MTYRVAVWVSTPSPSYSTPISRCTRRPPSAPMRYPLRTVYSRPVALSRITAVTASSLWSRSISS